MKQELENVIRSGKRTAAPSPDAEDAIPPEIQDQLFQEYMASALANDRDCPLRGQMLGVQCAYVMESALDGPGVKVGLTFDALAGKPPHLMTRELRIARNEPLEKSVADALARENTSPASLFQPLLEAVINATLYITSAGIKVDQYRLDRSKQPNREVPEACFSSDTVYYLPGKITISHMRKLQQVARGTSGRALMHRFMVRGHWRRPGSTWKDQSPRWIEPYMSPNANSISRDVRTDTGRVQLVDGRG